MELVSRAGVSKAHMRPDKAFMSSVMAGMLLSFACATLLTMNSSPWYQENAPVYIVSLLKAYSVPLLTLIQGFIRVVAALVFPYGLTMIVLSGTDLCTGSFMYTTVSVLHGRLSVVRMLLHWVITFFGNLAGSLFLVTIIAGYGGILSSSPYDAEVQSFAHTKQVVPQWHMIFLRGIGANWLVCMACFLGLSGRDYVSKLVGIWWPTFAFVSLGFDHVVANMFFIPIAIFQGSPDITVGLYIWKGMIRKCSPGRSGFPKLS